MKARTTPPLLLPRPEHRTADFLRGMLIGALLAALLLGCVSPSGSRPLPRSDSRIATQVELVDTQAPTLYEALERTKYLWLYGGRRIQSVFLEGVYFGNADALRWIATRDVSRVRLLDVSETGIFYGSRFAGPSVNVELKR